MSVYPKWLLVLAFINVLPLFLSIFFLFGKVVPYTPESNQFLRFLLYFLMQALWLVPIGCFFGGLSAYYNKGKVWGLGILFFGHIFTVIDFWLILR